MRKLSLIFFLILPFTSDAQKKDTVFTNSSLERATVYYGYGAELEHSSKIQLAAGMQHVVIDGLATQAEAGSVQISLPENITVMSFIYRVFQKPVTPKTPGTGKEADSIRVLQKQLSFVLNEQHIQEDLLRRTTSLIENNFTTPDKKNISSEELIRLTNFYNNKVKEIKERIYQLSIKRDELNEQIAAINVRVNQSLSVQNNNEVKPTGQLIMQVLASTSGSVDIGVTYYTRNAGWIPAYDIRMKSIDNSLKLAYRATITQSTGIEWNDVKLNLSTSDPNQGNRLPELNPLFLKLYVPSIVPAYDKSDAIKIPEMREVVVTSVDQKRNASQYSISRVNADDINDVGRHTALKESQLNINFEINLPYTIPSDGKAYIVNIKEEKLSAGYKHRAVPVLDHNAFLVASINRWDSLGLLPGEATIIMDNVYLGKSYIDPNSTADTLYLSLGRDKRISIDRQLVKEFSKKVSKGNSRIETFTYEITLRNNKKQAVSLDIMDQYPISTVKEVEVELTGDGKAEIDKDKGFLKWKVNLSPGERKVLRFSYQVKYPASSTVMHTR